MSEPFYFPLVPHEAIMSLLCVANQRNFHSGSVALHRKESRFTHEPNIICDEKENTSSKFANYGGMKHAISSSGEPRKYFAGGW